MDNNLKSKTITNLFWKFSERLVAQSVSLIVSIIIARILTPSDYSVVSIVTIFFTFANVFISSGMNTALIQKKNADALDYSNVFFVNIGISIILYFLLFFVAPWISQLYSQPILVSVIRVMALTLPINAIKAIWCAYISSSLQFRKYFFSNIGGALISAIVGISMACNGYGPWSLVAQQMSNTIVGTIILILNTRIHIVPQISFKRLRGLFSYGWKIFVASIISCIYSEINLLIVGVKYSTEDLAFYEKGKSFPSYASNSLSDALCAVMFPVMSKVQEEKETIKNFSRKFMKIGSYVIFPMMIGFLAISDNFVSVLLTDKWLSSSVYIKIFCISYMFDILNQGNLQTIKAIGRSDIVLKLEVIKKVSYLVVIILFLFFSPNPIILAYSSIVNSLAGVFLNAIPNKYLISYSFGNQIWDILPNLLMSAIMGVIVYSLSFININKLLLLLIQIFSGIFLYLSFSVISRNESFLYFVNYGRELMRKRKLCHDK